MEMKKAKKLLPAEIVNLYTDILAHKFEPFGDRLACGTSTGSLTVLERQDDRDDLNINIAPSFPTLDEAILGLDWGKAGIFVGVSRGFYWYQLNSKSGLIGEPAFTDCMIDVMDLRCLPDKNHLAVGCSDGKLRIFDYEALKFINTLDDLNTAIEVLSTSSEYTAVGARDGTVIVYESNFRTPKPVWKFSVDSKVTPGLSLSRNSTWLATGTHGSPAVYSLKIQTALPKFQSDNQQSIYSVEFNDEGSLWWGGEGGTVFCSEDMAHITSSMGTLYGDERVNHIYSIATGCRGQLSVAGSSNGVLLSANGKYWDSYVRI